MNANQTIAKLLNLPPRTLSATMQLDANRHPTITVTYHPNEHDFEAISREFELVRIEEVNRLREEVRALRHVVLIAKSLAQGALGDFLRTAAEEIVKQPSA